jgi:hypothetical protein
LNWYQFDEDAPVEQILGILETVTITDLVVIRDNNLLNDSVTATDNVVVTGANNGAYLADTAKADFCSA